ncbi:hypothetical protein [Actinoplanes sp. L3-i22]|uniref:hypothetical protein n=1 Tax=Actinoplanes sp. L3-i22 TaxID=2836373 RepID=UPI001C7613AD|nr:hypothetical protein [Actinoplanes sp. L3-i22]BCY12893.1 hypothetical protein L3i22_079810 [Actinoplanes sp. L3-i22]
MSVRGADLLSVDDYGTPRWRVPAGGVVFEVDAGEVVALDAAVRSATNVPVVVAEDQETVRLPLGELASFVRERLILFGLDLDLSEWMPDPAEVASRVDLEHWPLDPPVADADVTDLVLLAAMCAIGPEATAVDATGRWRGLGGFGEEQPEHELGPLPEGAIAVTAAVHDERVERLAFALLGPGRALLAITLA